MRAVLEWHRSSRGGFASPIEGTGQTMQRVDDGEQLTRRSFLRVGSLGAVALSLPGAPEDAARTTGVETTHPAARARACIFLLLTGGPSPLDTFDPRPDAPAEVRGPFGAIRTTVPGVWLSECLPRLARQLHRVALVRTVYHDELATHEAGLQQLLSGGLHRAGLHRPGLGAMISFLDAKRHGVLRPWFVLPEPLGNLGLAVAKGQDAGPLGEAFEPVSWRDGRAPVGTAGPGPAEAAELAEFRVAVRSLLRAAYAVHDEPESVLEAYGVGSFARDCLVARRLVERGARFVVVNMFTELFDTLSWDCHANGANLPVTLEDYRARVCPDFDRAFTALLEDLATRGLLDQTLVVAAGEIGRTYLVNGRGGRDHWTGCWSVLLAGAGVPGGAVVGRSDAYVMEPAERPVHVADIAATVVRLLGYAPSTAVHLPDGRHLPLADGGAIEELIAESSRSRNPVPSL